jgi:hypothetical protein
MIDSIQFLERADVLCWVGSFLTVQHSGLQLFPGKKRPEHPNTTLGENLITLPECAEGPEKRSFLAVSCKASCK